MIKTFFVSLLFVFFTSLSFAATSVRSTRVAVSQGISSPAISSPVNFSHGFVNTNPAVAADLPRPYISLEGTTGPGNSEYGAELGVGSGNAGLAAGYLKGDCCSSGRFGVIGGIGTGAVSAGLGFHEDSTYSLGMIFQPKGTHRIGLSADLHGSGSDYTSLGAGYSFHSSSFIFALDASRRRASGKSDIMLTPGLELMADIFSLSVSYDLFINDGSRRYDDQIWFGLGIGTDKIHLAAYHDYKNEWSAALSFWM